MGSFVLRGSCAAHRILALAFALVSVALLALAAGATAQGVDSCQNAPFRTGYGANLPDCRAYEQATAADKNGGNPEGGTNLVQAAPSGDGITFSSEAGLPGGVGAANYPIYMARRGTDSWSTSGLLPPQEYGTNVQMLGWTPDLDSSFSVASVARVGSAFLRQASSDHATDVVVPYTRNTTGSNGYAYVGASADGSKVYFETAAGLVAQPTSDAAPAAPNLFVWDRATGTVNLVGVLPGTACGSPPCVPAGGSFGGSYDWFNGSSGVGLAGGGAAQRYYTEDQHVVSTDGSKAYFTAGGTGQVYLRENAAEPTASTVHVSASAKTNGSGPAGGDPDGPRPAAFMAATPDGSQAFFTSSEELTNDANTGPAPALGRAGIDGSGADQAFLPGAATGVAVDGSHIYWADPQQDAIGRANLDGTAVDPDFITGAENPQYVAVDANYVYWTDAADGANGNGTIGRAALDGTGADNTFITGADNPQGLAVDSTHIYWANDGTTFGTQTIGRASLDGTEVIPKFIRGASHPEGVAIGAAHIYWATGDLGYIWQANLDGSGLSLLTTEASSPRGVAVDSSHLFWTNAGTGTIGRMNLDGTGLDESFITGAQGPQGLAVDGSNLYWANNDGDIGNDLYRFDVGSGLTDLTPDAGSYAGAEVKGVIGASNNGSYVYFVANGDLDGSGPATQGDCEEAEAEAGRGARSMQGTCNLYLWHDGTITFIAPLDTNSGGTPDTGAANWTPTAAYLPGFDDEKTARVTPDGRTLLFRSQRSLTGYDNNVRSGSCPGAFASGSACLEFYRYSADTGELQCVTCNPTGAPPIGSADLQTSHILAFDVSQGHGALLTRNLSDDGDRVFFQSPDQLVPQDTNGAGGCPVDEGASTAIAVLACQDVYMWEAAGSGSCPSASPDGGCLSLLSTGTGAHAAFFGDASESGDDVFLFTDQQLVPSDRDQLYDVYDARVGGGLATQHESPGAGCVGDACRGPLGAQPEPPSVGSGALSGDGNGRTRSHRRPTQLRVKRSGPARGPVAGLRARVPDAGRIQASARQIKPVVKRVSRAGVYRIELRLNKGARKALEARGRLRVKVRVSYRATDGRSARKAIKLTFKRAKAGAAKPSRKGGR